MSLHLLTTNLFLFHECPLIMCIKSSIENDKSLKNLYENLNLLMEYKHEIIEHLELVV